MTRWKHGLDIGALWGARLFSSACTVLVLGVGAAALDTARFAVFAFALGLVAWLPVLDFGFGPLVQNVVAARAARDRPSAVARTVHRHCAAAGLVALMAFPLVAFAAWIWLRITGSALLQEPVGVMVILVSMFFAGIAALSARALSGLGLLKQTALITALQNLLALAGTSAAMALAVPAERLQAGLVGYFVPYAAVPLVVLCMRFPLRNAKTGSWPGRVLRSAWDLAMFRAAAKYLWVTLLSLIVIQFDQFIAFSSLPATQYASYAVAGKIVSFAYFPFSAMLTANWTRVAHAHARRDAAAMMRTVYMSAAIGFVYLFLAAAAAIAALHWAAAALPANIAGTDSWMLAALFLVAINKVWTECFALLYLATNQVGIIGAYLPIQASLSVVLQLALVSPLGAYGLMLGGGLCYLLTSHWILFVYRHKPLHAG